MKEKEESTEQIIMQAARKVFVRKGYDGARMQEIADEAGINKALLHYYFRSKDKLFNAIFLEAVNTFLPIITSVINSEIPLFDKIRRFADVYIDILIKNPHIPHFVIHEITQHPQRIVGLFKHGGAKPEIFFNQVMEAVKNGEIKPIHPFQLIINVISLCVFPFIGRYIIAGMAGITQEEMVEILKERKQHVPEFIIDAIKLK